MPDGGDRRRDRDREGTGNDATSYVRERARAAGRLFERTRAAFREGRGDGAGAAAFDLPADDDGRARIVCRRYAERRRVAVDGDGRPDCFDADHPDCVGCAEDVREGVVETW
jgi:hypothetical protein